MASAKSLDDEGRNCGHTPGPGLPFLFQHKLSVFIRVQVFDDGSLAVATLYGDFGKDSLITKVLSALKLPDQEPLYQNLRIAALLCPVNEPMRLKRIGQNLDAFKPVIQSIGNASITHMLECRLNPFGAHQVR